MLMIFCSNSLRTRSRASWKGSGDSAVSQLYPELAKRGLSTVFTGYSSLQEETKILALVADGKEVVQLSRGQKGEVILERSPFYPEGGGQVGDVGTVEGNGASFRVAQSQKPSGALIVLAGEVETGNIQVNQSVVARVDRDTRLKTRINHTITHVLHATLQEVLGDHVKQAGSLVRPDYLRFDFAHFQSVSDAEIEKIEQIVNSRIRENSQIESKEEELEKAIAGGAKAFFDEKYGDRVRVISVGTFSKELCGGTHAEALGEAGLFKITSESSVASGVRRIVAVTGQKAIDYVREEEKIIADLTMMLKASPKDLVSRVDKLLKERADLQKKVTQGGGHQQVNADDLIKELEGIRTIVHIAKVDNAKDLRTFSDQLKQKVKSGVVVLGAAVEGKVTVLVSVTDDLAPRFGMDRFVKTLSSQLDGRGGGKPNFAQIGGSNIAALNETLLSQLLASHLKA
jgi:alanyl-tRNA synthetase